MSSASMKLYEQSLVGLFLGALKGYGASDLSAHILGPSYVPDLSAHATLDQVAVHEVAAADYAPQAVSGVTVTPVAGTVIISADPIVFGDPVTIPPFRYLLLAYGLPTVEAARKSLVGYADLSPNGGAREAVDGAVVMTFGSNGWISLTQS